MSTGSLLSKPYPTKEEWCQILKQFSPEAIAHKMLLAQVPYVFKDEPLKFALFRKTIADAFHVDPTNVFIVGSAMAGRSLKGDALDKEYATDSDFDTLIISEHLFTSYVMKSLAWVKDITKPDFSGNHPVTPSIDAENAKYVGWLANHAYKGIWRPDSLPHEAEARIDFFTKFEDVSLKTLGLQLSEDTVAKVNGRIARSFDDAVKDLSSNLYRLDRELEGQPVEPDIVPDNEK